MSVIEDFFVDLFFSRFSLYPSSAEKSFRLEREKRPAPMGKRCLMLACLDFFFSLFPRIRDVALPSFTAISHVSWGNERVCEETSEEE